jgi:hypothetical protein
MHALASKSTNTRTHRPGQELLADALRLLLDAHCFLAASLACFCLLACCGLWAVCVERGMDERGEREGLLRVYMCGAPVIAGVYITRRGCMAAVYATQHACTYTQNTTGSGGGSTHTHAGASLCFAKESIENPSERGRVHASVCVRVKEAGQPATKPGPGSAKGKKCVIDQKQSTQSNQSKVSLIEAGRGKKKEKAVTRRVGLDTHTHTRKKKA